MQPFKPKGTHHHNFMNLNHFYSTCLHTLSYVIQEVDADRRLVAFNMDAILYEFAIIHQRWYDVNYWKKTEEELTLGQCFSAVSLIHLSMLNE